MERDGGPQIPFPPLFSRCWCGCDILALYGQQLFQLNEVSQSRGHVRGEGRLRAEHREHLAHEADGVEGARREDVLQLWGELLAETRGGWLYVHQQRIVWNGATETKNQ